MGKSILIEYKGEVKTSKEWSKETGIPSTLITLRIRRGFTIEQALTIPKDISVNNKPTGLDLEIFKIKFKFRRMKESRIRRLAALEMIHELRRKRYTNLLDDYEEFVKAGYTGLVELQPMFLDKAS